MKLCLLIRRNGPCSPVCDYLKIVLTRIIIFYCNTFVMNALSHCKQAQDDIPDTKTSSICIRHFIKHTVCSTIRCCVVNFYKERKDGLISALPLLLLIKGSHNL